MAELVTQQPTPKKWYEYVFAVIDGVKSVVLPNQSSPIETQPEPSYDPSTDVATSSNRGSLLKWGLIAVGVLVVVGVVVWLVRKKSK